MSVEPRSGRMNRLGGEKSPYLLQHRYNPVDWRPWGEEAFAAARAQERPIFLSIGYSTCHWCHVMERECFEDEGVAALLNAHFVSIKVDREERPDVDRIYMTFVQAMTGAGGWPLNVFLTPELKPFYGGTYFPPEARSGRPSFGQVLERVRELWAERRDDLLRSAEDLHGRLSQHLTERPAGEAVLSERLLARAAAVFKGEYEPRHGGFGEAPKFPRPSVPRFLLVEAERTGDEEARRMVVHTSERMAAGGLYDQLGGGFARYSVDGEWLVPHFEKMLYDNAQLLDLYLDVYLVTGREEFARTARGVIDYVRRDLTHPEGGFYSAEDADSEGQEGKFYCWTRREMEEVLAAEECRVATRYFGVTERGNFVDHSHPDPLPDLNVLSVVDPALSGPEAGLLESAKAKLRAVRGRRVRPGLDDKVLTSWNGMMLGALARASVVLGDEGLRQAAERNAAFVRGNLWDAASRTLYHRWREGERDRVQLLGAYAHWLNGLLDLYEATLDPGHLEWALEVAGSMVERLEDPEEGGFWQSGGEATELIVRVKDDYDGAEPSGNSAAMVGLLRLGAITGREAYRAAAWRGLRLLAGKASRVPQAMPHWLLGLGFALAEPVRVVLTGDPAEPAMRRWLRAAHGVYRPHRVILGTRGPVEAFAAGLAVEGKGPMAYVCGAQGCQAPVGEPEGLLQLMESVR